MSSLAKVSLILSFIGAQAFAIQATYHGLNHFDLGVPDDLQQQFTEAGLTMPGISMGTVAGCNCAGKIDSHNIHDPGCYDRYKKMYKNPIVNMKVVFGYEDSGPGKRVNDRFICEALRHQAHLPCPPNAKANNMFLCGFNKTDNAEVWEKPGVVDPDGHVHTVRLTIVDSSISPFDSDNRSVEGLPWQNMASQHAHDEFMNNVCDTDAEFYVGHGRGGAGPGFFLPTYTATGEVDYADAKLHHDTIDELATKLTGCTMQGKGPTFLSLSACPYDVFGKDLKKAAPKMALQLANKLGFENDDPKELFGTLNGLLGEICEPALSQSANPSTIDPRSKMVACYPEPVTGSACFPK